MNDIARPSGCVLVQKITDSTGRDVSYEKAVKYGWFVPGPGMSAEQCAANAGVDQPNLFVDQGRQLLAYAFSFRSPIENFVCSRFSVGTGTKAPNATDIALEAPITLSSGSALGNIDSIDFPSAFVVRIAFTLGLSDANGFLITERGLFSGNGSLIARTTRAVGINKTSDFAPTLLWLIRF